MGTLTDFIQDLRSLVGRDTRFLVQLPKIALHGKGGVLYSVSVPGWF